MEHAILDCLLRNHRSSRVDSATTDAVNVFRLTRSESFAVFGVADAKDGVFVAFERLNQSSVVGVVNEDASAGSHNQLKTVRPVRDRTFV